MKKLNSIDEVIASMPERFCADASLGVNATYQWHVQKGNGDQDRDFCICVEDGSFKVVEGRVNSPSVTLKADLETYLRLVNGELKAMTAIMTRRLSIYGNIFLGSKMDRIFK